ncbi:MAG: stage V sporulation protein E [Bacillota bacterium]|jgi:cell division protein FtsW|nr:stage V sporulation protein E [Bacillota bacterium]MDI9415435.1 stage V sporulation protein E [Bacillota bacterium]NLD13062.1 stage V sporulation protein E [Bacillota bacterium]
MSRKVVTRKRKSGASYPPDIVIFLITLTLLSIGVVMVFSASSVTARATYGDTYYFLKRQLAWAAIGVFAMIVTMQIDYDSWRKLAWPVLIVALLLLLVVLVPGFGTAIRGSRRWLDIGPLTFQPSEVAKLAMVLFMASFLSNRIGKMHLFTRGLLPPLIIVGIVFGLIVLEPDFGTAGTVLAVSFVMMFAAGASILHLASLAALGLPALGAMAIAAPYRARRFLAFLDPWEDPLGSGFHIIQSLLALGSGGLFGVGLGRSRQKFLYLPMQHTDFIFAIIGEELGFVGAAFVLILYFLFAWRGLRIAIATEDPFGKLLAVGITTMIVSQAIINIGVVSGALPITGITLPLISSGGSSLVTTLAAIGVLLNISKHSALR